MGFLRTIIIAALAGLGLGVGLAYYEVGQAEAAFAPPAVGEIKASNGEVATVQQAFAQAQIDEESHDFGTMERGSTKTHAFQFTNTGDAPLRLEVGQTTCKCTLGDVDDGPIAPGESTPVRLEWVAKVNVGLFKQTATIKTNDPRRPEIDLEVRGFVTDTTGLEPEQLLLGKMTADEVRESRVWLVAYGETPIETTARMADTTHKPELYKLSVEPIEEIASLPLPGATSGVRIDLVAGPRLPLGVLNAWVEVTTNLPEAPMVRIPVLAHVEGEISIHGRGWAKQLGMLILGNVPSDKGKEAKLLVSFKGEHADDATIEVSKATPEWLEAEVGPRRQVRDGVTHFPLTVRIPKGRAPVIHSGTSAANGGQGEGDASITLQTNSPDTPEVDVRVRFVVIEGKR